MAKQLYMRVTAPSYIFARVDGPGVFLHHGETILAERVRQSVLDEIENGGKASRNAELVELDDEQAEEGGVAETASPTPNRRSGRIDTSFDPTGKKVEEVMAYLKETTPEEVDRVKALEASNGERQGGPSKTVAAYEPESS